MRDILISRSAGAVLCTLPALLLVLLLVQPAEARDHPIYNVADRPFPQAVRENLNLEAIGKAIMTAGQGRNANWIYRELAPGRVNAELFIRKHWARVLIRFDETSFSISYVDSRLLRYRGTTIHRNYNKWIRNLENDILNAVTSRAQSE